VQWIPLVHLSTPLVHPRYTPSPPTLVCPRYTPLALTSRA